MAPHEYHLVRYAKKHNIYYYGRINDLLSEYNEPNVTVMAVGVTEKIATALSETKATEHIENGSKEHYAVFNDGGGWGEVTLLDSRESLESFIAWASGRDLNGDNSHWDSVFFKDPLHAPKAFKRCNALSPVLVLGLRRPEEETLAGTGEHIKELMLKTAAIQASIAKSLVENITIPDFNNGEEDKDDEEDKEDKDDYQR